MDGRKDGTKEQKIMGDKGEQGYWDMDGPQQGMCDIGYWQKMLGKNLTKQ